METTPFDRNRLISTLMKIGHGDLSLYLPQGLPAARTDPDLFAHLIAWNHAHGKVHDSKVAYPVIALRGVGKGGLAGNALAHLMSLGPRELVRALTFSKQLTKAGHVVATGAGNALEFALKRYLRAREAKRGWWDKTVVSHRAAMRTLYAVSHTKPAPFAQDILFGSPEANGKVGGHRYHESSVFAAIANLRTMAPAEAAGTILNFSIPFPVALGALGHTSEYYQQHPEFALAFIERMTGNQLINNADMLKRLGVESNPVLKSAFDDALVRAKSDTRLNTLKVQKAAQVVGGASAEKLIAVQDAHLDKSRGIEGNWLVLGDASGSMQHSIEIARQIAGLIAQQVKGQVHLAFFNTFPRFFDVTGLTLSQIQTATQHIYANGGTSIGCALEDLARRNIAVDGIALVSDGGDNTDPLFHNAYQLYTESMHIQPSVHFFHVAGEPPVLINFCQRAGVSLEIYELLNNTDLYSLPNIVSALKVGRYALLEEILSTPLLTLEQVFSQ